jgi:putative ABC transport system permease protein
MIYKESFYIAMDALRTNKLRAILTTLGIVIGVMTVIGMMTIIRGINATVEDQFSRIGTNTFYIQKYPAIQTDHTMEQYRNRKDITIEQAETLRERAKLVSRVTPELGNWGERARYGGEKTNADVYVIGSNSDWQIVNGRYVKDGRFLSPMDIRSARYVCIIGTDIVETLFPFEDPLNKNIRVGAKRYRIVGILEEQGSIFGQSQDNIVVIPYTAFQREYGTGWDVSIAVQARQTELLDVTLDEVIGILRVERKVPPGQPNDFEVITRDSLTDAWKNLTGVVFVAAVGIAMISLLVGGIGIMNIMLVSVTERTREIGIRKSIGARRKDILWQFIVEAIFLSALGGLIGIVAGIGLGKLIGSVTPLPAAVPVWAVFVGLGFSSMVGLFFGIYPAAKAAKLDPIVALRYE